MLAIQTCLTNMAALECTGKSSGHCFISLTKALVRCALEMKTCVLNILHGNYYGKKYDIIKKITINIG